MLTIFSFLSLRFGAEKGKSAGPDRATTTVGENINLKISVGGTKVSVYEYPFTTHLLPPITQ